jgi:hypothetical protein
MQWNQERWINMFQNFIFKILHSTCDKHGNVGALSRNQIDEAKDEEENKSSIKDLNFVEKQPMLILQERQPIMIIL